MKRLLLALTLVSAVATAAAASTPRAAGVITLAAADSGHAVSATAPNAADSTHVLTFIEVKADAAERGKQILKNYVRALRKEAPLAKVGLLQEVGRPERFVLLETAKDDLTTSATHAHSSIAPLDELLTAPLDRRTHTVFGDAAPASSTAASEGYVVTHFDIASPDRTGGEAALHDYIAAARNASGNISSVAWQQTQHTNHFNLILVWRTPAALHEFAASGPSLEFRKAVAPLLGSPYDERLYHRVD